ncbi:tRNA (adenosine(37)-N6)-threonylcarbamoyltransferase complex dimerization subunit type 1 TsaB, partial [Allorhizocola rhizosphaerae]|uniref:tRNA (adenosine(37)-N6)-threonylcarbamoyltransferase complex dimerization subunit type 1 TsaB n=1 Tax=Allorhizocola rhizosphaerae TaxID=1872709 RepID=UPI000E3D848A
MLVLAIDTATPAISAALAEVGESGVRMLGERVTVDGRAHAERLTPQIASLLAEAGVKPRDLGALAAGVGPGPFTGLRVGLMTAATMAGTLGVPVYGVSTLDVLGAFGKGRVLAATDARRREVYWAVYEDGVRTDLGPAVDKPSSITSLLAERGVLSGVGEGAAKYADVLGLVPPAPQPSGPAPLA